MLGPKPAGCYEHVPGASDRGHILCACFCSCSRNKASPEHVADDSAVFEEVSFNLQQEGFGLTLLYIIPERALKPV